MISLTKYVLYWPLLFEGKVVPDEYTSNELDYDGGEGWGGGDHADCWTGDGWGDSPWGTNGDGSGTTTSGDGTGVGVMYGEQWP